MGVSWLKTIFMSLNAALVFAGLGLMVVSALVVYSSYESAIPENFKNLVGSSNWTLAFGLITFVSPFFGFFGASTETKGILRFYSIFIILITIGQLGLSCWIYHKINNTELESAINSSFGKTFSNYYKDDKNKALVDLIQTNFECCGINGTDYWLTNDTPNSCCAISQSGQSNCGKHHTKACPESFYENFQWWIHTLEYFSFGVFVLEVVLCISLVYYYCVHFTSSSDQPNTPDPDSASVTSSQSQAAAAAEPLLDRNP